ncbi:MAG TPA: glutaredoxin domain-containing protein [Nitrospiria bacterium]
MPAIQIYTTKSCGYCVRAMQLLKREGIPFEEIDITDTPEKRDELLAITGERTVPQIFVDGKYVGQDDELYELVRSGALKA